MAKLSRSKQPEFDPRELEDLIFTPAVGTGVGSHLLQPFQSESETPQQTPITPLSSESAKVTSPPIKADEQTIVMCVPTTVVDSGLSDSITSRNNSLELTEGSRLQVPTVVMPEPHLQTSHPYAKTVSLWITESGEIVPESRVRRIRLAQDVLNSAEEAVYDTLWNAKGASKVDAESFRISQAGYDYLMKRTRLSKKTVQRIIDRLLDKDFIAIERPADIYRRTSTTYRVFSYRTVLDRHAAKGRFYAVKIGPGFLFARKLENRSDLTTVASSISATDVSMATQTVVESRATTVVPQTTKIIEQSSIDISSSSDVVTLKQLLESKLGLIDDDAVKKLLQECRSRAGDCTVKEIAFFVAQKLRLIQNIHNPVGFMLAAIPRHFQNDGHLPVRDLLQKQAEQEAQAWRDAYAFWSKIAASADSSPEERAQAQSVINDLKKSPERPRFLNLDSL